LDRQLTAGHTHTTR